MEKTIRRSRTVPHQNIHNPMMEVSIPTAWGPALNESGFSHQAKNWVQAIKEKIARWAAQYFLKQRWGIAWIAAMMVLGESAKLYAPDPVLKPVTAEIALRQTVPSKIFTPNGDGVNDLFTILVENPSGGVMSLKKIYSLSGFEVADLAVVGDETAAIVQLTWNGKDNGGSDAHSGIYLYQVQSEGKSINGTIVIAR